MTRATMVAIYVGAMLWLEGLVAALAWEDGRHVVQAMVLAFFPISIIAWVPALVARAIANGEIRTVETPCGQLLGYSRCVLPHGHTGEHSYRNYWPEDY